MNSNFLSVLLMALVLVVACAAMPGTIGGETIKGQPITSEPITIMPNTTNIPKRMSTFSMGCKTNGDTKICTNDNKLDLVVMDAYTDVTNHFLNGLPDWKKYTSYEFCFGDSCAAMTTLTGSEFYPKNYEHVAVLAVQELYQTRVCVSDGWGLYPQDVDVYYYSFNFVFSFWFNEVVTESCR